MASGLQPYTSVAQPKERNYLNESNNYWIRYYDEEHPDYINLKDPRPNRRPTNDLSVNYPKATAEQIAKTANLWGVDPYLAMAAAWKETMGGRKSVAARSPGWHAYLGYTNPMQANSAIFKEYPGIEADYQEKRKAYVNKLSDYTTEEIKKLGNTPEAKAAIDAELYKAWDTYHPDMVRKKNIEGGVAKLYDNKVRYPDNIDLQIARYRGNVGTDNTHVSDVRAFYEALKKDKRLEYLRNLK